MTCYETYNNVLCVNNHILVKSEENLNGFVSRMNYDNMVRRSKLIVARPGKGKGNYSLVRYDSLPAAWQNVLTGLYGEADKQAELKPLKDRIVTDVKARDFFNQFRYGDDDRELSGKLKNLYIANASVMNAIHTLFTNATNARARAGYKLRGFWAAISPVVNDLRKDFMHKLPNKAITLERKYREYITSQGVDYMALVNNRLGNKNRDKITPAIYDWYITEMANTHQSVEMVYLRFLPEAVKQGWNTNITSAAFRAKMSTPQARQLIQLKRFGRKGMRQLNGMTFKLINAKYSNDIWVSDGTALSLYYKKPVISDKTGKFLKYTYAMSTTYMVMDEQSQKILGYATKEGINKENFEMQLEAYRAALRTAGAKPYQLLFDNQGGHKNATSREFYGKLAHVFFPTRAYRPSGKEIERGFGKFQALKLTEFPFWAGYGRKSHAKLNYAPNMDWIEANIDSLPDYSELLQLLAVIVAEWNDLAFNGAPSPNALYDANRNPEEEAISLDELSELFWNIQGPKKYHAWGINLRYKGEDITYEVYDEQGDVNYDFRRKFLHQKLYLRYDPDGEYPDVDLLEMAQDGSYRRVATASRKREVSRSVKYLNEGDKAWIERQLLLESTMFDDMDKEIAAMGFDEAKKATAWRDKLPASRELVPVGANHQDTLYGSEDSTMDIIE